MNHLYRVIDKEFNWNFRWARIWHTDRSSAGVWVTLQPMKPSRRKWTARWLLDDHIAEPLEVGMRVHVVPRGDGLPRFVPHKKKGKG